MFAKFDRYWNAAAVEIDRVIYLPHPRRHGAALQSARGHVPADRARCRRPTSATVRGDARLQLYESAVARLPRAVDQHDARRGGEDAARQQRARCARRSSSRSIAPSSTRSPSTARSCRATSRRRPARRTTPPPSRCRRAILRAPRRSLPTSGAGRADGQGPDRLRSARRARRAGDPGDGGRGRLRREDQRRAKPRPCSRASPRAITRCRCLIWSGRADPDANISIWVACDGFVNYGKYCEPKLDEILRRARARTDVAPRAARSTPRRPRSTCRRGRICSSIT